MVSSCLFAGYRAFAGALSYAGHRVIAWFLVFKHHITVFPVSVNTDYRYLVIDRNDIPCYTLNNNRNLQRFYHLDSYRPYFLHNAIHPGHV